MNMAKVIKETTVVTNKVRLGYVHVLEPHAFEGQDPKYSVQLMIPKSDDETITCIKKAVKTVFETAKTDKLKGMTKPKNPLRDGDEEANDDGEPRVPGHYFMSVSSKKRPVVVKKVEGMKVETTDPNDIYSGVLAFVSINFFAYNTAGNKGITAGLNNILTTSKGERLGGGTTVDEDFGDLDWDDEESDDDMFV